jgi:hypothetical protein
MTIYTFANSDRTMVARGDGAFVPWDPQKNQPSDYDGFPTRVWKQDGSPAPAPYVAPPTPPVTTVTRVQGMIQLSRAGLLTRVQTLVAADPEMQIWFNHAPTWERNNARILALAQSLGLSAGDLDNLFQSAAAVTP